MSKLNVTLHKKLEKFCIKQCTRALGWNAVKRQECRECSMCNEANCILKRLETNQAKPGQCHLPTLQDMLAMGVPYDGAVAWIAGIEKSKKQAYEDGYEDGYDAHRDSEEWSRF